MIRALPWIQAVSNEHAMKVPPQVNHRTYGTWQSLAAPVWVFKGTVPVTCASEACLIAEACACVVA